MPQCSERCMCTSCGAPRNELSNPIPGIAAACFSYCGVFRHRKCVLLAANGVLDHVHLLVSIHRTSTISDSS